MLLINFVLQFFLTDSLFQNVNSSFVTLIPKVEGATSISQFRSISMTNFFFKIITKILADRFSITNRVISNQQYAFIKGRHMSDCIGIVSETINMMDKKCLGGNIAIKLDTVKAFDTLDWSFLLQVLTSFGFDKKFVFWVQAILAFARLSILVIGTPKGYFSCSRGVRQGDPLSPLLLFC